MYIGETWVNTNVENVLAKAEFYSTDFYNDKLKDAKNRVDFWFTTETELLAAFRLRRVSDYIVCQAIYSECFIGSYASRIQASGRRVYKRALIENIKEAIAPEYDKLPAFAKEGYSLDDYALRCVNNIMKKDINKINREITERFYAVLRNEIRHKL